MISPRLVISLVACSSLAFPLFEADPVVAQPAATLAVAPSERLTFDVANREALYDMIWLKESPLNQAASRATAQAPIEVTLRLADGEFRLPYKIDFPNVHLIITSARTLPKVGVDNPGTTRAENQGATLTKAISHAEDVSYPTTVMSPLTVRNLNIDSSKPGVPHFIPEADLTIEDIYTFDGWSSYTPSLVSMESENTHQG